MKRLGLALAAAAALSALPLAAPTAWAQRIQSADKSKAADPAQPSTTAPTKITPADKVRGMKEAPPLVAASIVKTCQVTDAAFRGSGTQKGADGKASKVTIYEVVCQQGPGYLVLASEGQPAPQMLNCFTAAGGTKCALPQNGDFKAALSPYVREVGRTCDISGQRYVGTAASTGLTYYELACGQAPGFVISVATASAAKTEVNDCLQLEGTPLACTLTTKPQMLQIYAANVAKSGKSCSISDVRQIGRDRNNPSLYTEIGCGSAPGFVLVTDLAGVYKSTIDCGKADSLGGCKLTDVAVAQTADSAAYSKLASKAGFPCAVKQYRFIGMDATNREVVELACNDHPEGAMAAFSDAGKSDVYDCVRGPALGGSECKLTDKALVYPKYTAALAAKGRTTCKVSTAGFLGRTQAGEVYVEAACADGAPGWVMSFKSGASTPDELLTCRQASNAGLPCKLPTNTGSGKG